MERNDNESDHNYLCRIQKITSSLPPGPLEFETHILKQAKEISMKLSLTDRIFFLQLMERYKDVDRNYHDLLAKMKELLNRFCNARDEYNKGNYSKAFNALGIAKDRRGPKQKVLPKELFYAYMDLIYSKWDLTTFKHHPPYSKKEATEILQARYGFASYEAARAAIIRSIRTMKSKVSNPNSLQNLSPPEKAIIKGAGRTSEKNKQKRLSSV